MNFFKLFFSTSAKETFYILFTCIISGIASGMLTILYSNAAVNIFLNKDIYDYMVILPLTAIIFVLSQRLCRQKISRLVEDTLENMVLKILNTVRHEELSEFQQHNRTEIQRSITNVEIITDAGLRCIENLENNIALFIGVFYIFFYISNLIGLIILFWRLLFLLYREAFGHILVSAAHDEIQQQTNVFSLFQHFLQGFKELKFTRKKNEDLYGNYLVPLVKQIEKLRIRSGLYLQEFVILYFCSYYLIMGIITFIFFSSFSAGMTINTLIILTFLTVNDLMIFTSVPVIAEGSASLERIQKLFEKTQLKEIHQNLNTELSEYIHKFDTITMKNIYYSYPETHSEAGFSVEIDSLTVKSGEILFVTGGNGSGKSTLLHILAGLYTPNKGEIRIDDMPVSMPEYRGLFSVIFSDFHLFDRLYGIDTPDVQKLDQLLELTELDEKVSYQDGSFNTHDLSAGQKKRLALVAAMMEDKPVYIFDEWAAEQDPDFRRYFYEELLPMLKREGKTIVVITHDDRFFHTADTVIRMEYGKITESWRQKHESLLQPKDGGIKGGVPLKGIIQEEMAFSKEEEPIKPFRDHFKDEYAPKQGKEKSRGLLGLFKQMIQEDGASVKHSVFFMIVSSFCMVGIYLTIIFAAQGQSDQSKTFLLIQFVILILLYIATQRRTGKLFYQASENRIAKLRLTVTGRIRKTNLQALEQTGAGKIYTVLSSDIKAISDASNIIFYCISGALRFIMSYIYIGFLYLPAFAIIVLTTIVGAGCYSYNQSFIIRFFEQIRNQEKNLFTAISGLFNGFKELRINPQKSDDFYHHSLKHHISLLKDLKIQSVRYYINNHTIAYTFWQIILLMTTLIMPFTGLPTDVTPVAVGLLIMAPLRQIVDRYSKFYMAYMSILRLYQFEDKLKSLAQEPDVTAKPEELIEYKEILYNQLSFIYKAVERHPFSIGPLNLLFKSGNTVFITGGNGTGKSTLLKVITGLYPAYSGKIFFNGKEIDIRSYQELFGVIFSDFHLFDRFYGMKKVDSEKLTNLLRRFQLDNKVKWINGKFSTLDLSTGQKKRLALIVTIMEDKPIYVFDEWAAEQDPYFREYFYLTLLPEFKAQGKTVIAVTHDDRYFHLPDKIIHMEYGQVTNISSS